MLNGGGGVRGLWSMQGASVCGRRAAYVKGGKVGLGKTNVYSTYTLDPQSTVLYVY